MFQDIPETEKAFLEYKNNKSKNWEFSTGVSPWFWSKIGQENVFYDILQRKNAFLGYKNKKFKKVEKLTFFQRG